VSSVPSVSALLGIQSRKTGESSKRDVVVLNGESRGSVPAVLNIGPGTLSENRDGKYVEIDEEDIGDLAGRTAYSVKMCPIMSGGGKAVSHGSSLGATEIGSVV